MPTSKNTSNAYAVEYLRASELAKAKPDLDNPIQPAQSICAVIPVLPNTETGSLVNLLQSRAGQAFRLLVVEDDLAQGPTRLLNLVYHQNREPLFIYLAQDVFPSRLWLARAIKAMMEKKLALLAFNDGKWAGQMAGFGMVRRDWCSKVYGNSLFFSGYQQHFGDAELSLIARHQNVYGYDPNVVMMEVDFNKDKRAVNANDRELFAQRKLSGFDGRVSDPELLGLFA